MAFAFVSCQKENPQPVENYSTPTNPDASFRVAAGAGFDCSISSIHMTILNGGSILQFGEGSCTNEVELFQSVTTIPKDSTYSITIQENHPTVPLIRKQTIFDFQIESSTGNMVVVNQTQGDPVTITKHQSKNIFYRKYFRSKCMLI